MRTRSQSRNLDRQQQQAPPAFVEPFNLEEPIENQAPPVVTMDDNRTMAQLLEAPTEGYEDAIVVPEITAENFELKHDHFYDEVPERPETINLRNEITRFQQRFDETFYEAWDRFNDLLWACPRHGFSELHQLDTFYNALNSNDQDSLNSDAGGNFLDKMPRECLRIIESKSKVHNSRNKSVVAKVGTGTSTSGISPEVAVLTTDVAELKDMMKTLIIDKQKSQAPATVKAVEEKCVANFNQGNTGYRAPIANQIRPLGFPPVNQPPAYQDPAPQTQGVTRTDFESYVNANDAVIQNIQTNITTLTNSNLELKNMFRQFMKMNTASSSGTGSLPSNTIPNPKEDLKGITTRSGVAYQGPTIPTTSSSPKVVERETEPVVTPVSALMPNLKPKIPYPSRRNDERHREKANDQIEKFYEIFKDLSFEISLTDALILMPKFASTLKALIGNKEKLSEMARTPLNEHCSVVILNKLPKKLGDPDKFLIPCDFPGLDEYLALADLGASINLVPLFVWEKLSLPVLTPTCMNLELVDLVDFDADPRVPLILGRSFLKTGRALIDVYEGELTLRVRKEAVTFNLDQTSRYSSNYDDMTANRIDVIEMAYEEYSQEVLGFSDVIASGNPTPYYDLIVSTSSPTLTPFGDSDFLLLEEADAFLTLKDGPTSPEVDDSYYDSEGDILLLEAILNSDPLPPPPNQGNYLPEIQKELKVCEAKTDKSSIDEPPEVELKDLPPHLEYAFLEGDNKLPVIIAKDLSVEEKAALIKVLKSHKRAIAWKLSDIKGINPEFYTHKILMEEDYKPAVGILYSLRSYGKDYKPAVQHQRRVNPNSTMSIKKGVEKLLDRP
ncbi:hypothetical protein Tco_0186484 [Tanacetum coccineum]